MLQPGGGDGGHGDPAWQRGTVEPLLAKRLCASAWWQGAERSADWMVGQAKVCGWPAGHSGWGRSGGGWVQGGRRGWGQTGWPRGWLPGWPPSWLPGSPGSGDRAAQRAPHRRCRSSRTRPEGGGAVRCASSAYRWGRGGGRGASSACASSSWPLQQHTRPAAHEGQRWPGCVWVWVQAVEAPMPCRGREGRRGVGTATVAALKTRPHTPTSEQHPQLHSNTFDFTATPLLPSFPPTSFLSSHTQPPCHGRTGSAGSRCTP